MKIKFIFFILLFVFTSIFCFANNKLQNTDISVETQKLDVIFDSNSYNDMNLYNISGSKFVSTKELAKLLNTRIEWYSVSKKISIKLKNKTIDIYYDSRKIGFGKDKEKLSIPSILINDDVYVPIELLQLKKFSTISETILEFDNKHAILSITSKSNISAVRYYTKENNTEIVIELDEKMTHTIKKAKNSIIVSFQRGKIAKNNVIANNGAIKDISYETKNREAVFTINLEQTPKSVRTKKFKKPLKLVVEIEHSKPVDIAQPCNIYIPDTVLLNDAKIKTEEKILNETEIKKENINKEQAIKQTTERTVEQEKNDIDVPVIDAKIIAEDSQIYDKPKVEADLEDSQALSKVQTVTVCDEQVIDNSYAIIDDTETFKDIIPKAKDISKTAKIVVLDAGHGGHDPGAIGPHGVKEKDINLAIVLYLEKLFKKDNNYKVILTRDDDTFIPLVERANIANKNKADLFVSVHCNANLKRTASGFEIYFLSEKASDTEAVSTETLENSRIQQVAVAKKNCSRRMSR